MITLENKNSAEAPEILTSTDFNGKDLGIGDRVFGIAEFEGFDSEVFEGWISDFWTNADGMNVASLSSTPDLQNVSNHEAASRLVLVEAANK